MLTPEIDPARLERLVAEGRTSAWYPDDEVSRVVFQEAVYYAFNGQLDIDDDRLLPVMCALYAQGLRIGYNSAPRVDETTRAFG